MKTILREYLAFAGEALHGVWGHAFKAVGETIQAALFIVGLAAWLLFFPLVFVVAIRKRGRKAREAA